MKYLLISDVHGSSGAMEKIESIILENNFDRIISLGDILYHGPRNDLPEGYNPKKVIEVINKYHDKFIFIQGNCDAEVDAMVLKCKFYKRKKIRVHNRNIYLTHGHHLSRFDVDEKLNNGDIVIYGHYHVFDISQINGVIYINIGSTSIPKDLNKQYAIMDNEKIVIYSLDDNHIIGEYYL